MYFNNRGFVAANVVMPQTPHFDSNTKACVCILACACVCVRWSLHKFVRRLGINAAVNVNKYATNKFASATLSAGLEEGECLE